MNMAMIKVKKIEVAILMRICLLILLVIIISSGCVSLPVVNPATSSTVFFRFHTNETPFSASFVTIEIVDLLNKKIYTTNRSPKTSWFLIDLPKGTYMLTRITTPSLIPGFYYKIWTDVLAKFKVYEIGSALYIGDFKIDSSGNCIVVDESKDAKKFYDEDLRVSRNKLKINTAEIEED